MKSKKPIKKTLILNYRKWRCGRDGKGNSHGQGSTRLLNSCGYMCCLGQFSPQLNPEITRENLLEGFSPEDLDKTIPGLTTKRGVINTYLSNQAIEINDDRHTTITEKIKSLKGLFKEHGYRIKVVNLPKAIVKDLKK